jgi:hypothetical protein
VTTQFENYHELTQFHYLIVNLQVVPYPLSASLPESDEFWLIHNSLDCQNNARLPTAHMVSTTVNQATQAQRMIQDLGRPNGVRSALGVDTTTSSNDLAQELRLLLLVDSLDLKFASSCSTKLIS